MLEELWTLQNFLGTTLVICGITILSSTQEAKDQWRRRDLVYPVMAAVAFGVSSNLRKLGLIAVNLPLLAAAVTALASFLLIVCFIRARGGWQTLRLSRSNCGWFFAAGCANTAATLSVFLALSFGDVVVVEPLTASNPVLSILFSALFLKDLEKVTGKVVLGGLCTVAGTILVMAR